MFDIGFQELTIIGIVALLVVGPERLPGLARNVGLWVGRIRRYVAHVKDDIDREIRAQELRELIDKPKEELNQLRGVLDETKSAVDSANAELEAGREAFSQTETLTPTPGDASTDAEPRIAASSAAAETALPESAEATPSTPETRAASPAAAETPATESAGTTATATEMTAAEPTVTDGEPSTRP